MLQQTRGRGEDGDRGNRGGEENIREQRRGEKRRGTEENLGEREGKEKWQINLKPFAVQDIDGAKLSPLDCMDGVSNWTDINNMLMHYARRSAMFSSVYIAPRDFN